MTENEQRIAIAEAYGFVWYRIPNPSGRQPEHRTLALPELQEYEGQSDHWKVRADGTERVCNMEYMAKEFYVPDYLHDLNAMHEAEDLVLSREGLWGAYETWLYSVTECRIKPIFRVTAAQRAEAFLRTIGKWRD